MTTTTRDEIYYDPYDPDLQRDPYPMFRRMREEAPLYYNEPHDFFAVTRFDDCEAALKDPITFSSAESNILELIKAKIELPSGVFIFEDPPLHTAHRGLLSRVFTPKKMNALEPRIRALCAEVLDPLVGSDRLDFVADLGARMPMSVIGMLLGIPIADQEDLRQHKDEGIRREVGKPGEFSEDQFADATFFEEYINWRREHPSDDLMTALIQAEFEDETGTTRTPHPRRAADLRQRARHRRQRDDQPGDRPHRQDPRRAPGPAPRAARRSLADPERGGGDPAVRASGAPGVSRRDPRRRAPRPGRARRAAR